MTIKDFARLCGCNPQTLRYYDHVNLLKPARVDPWSGYRFYEETQALTFVKIKNLQRAGFTIGEIRKLLDQDQDVVCEALHAKIVEQENRLRELRLIQRSYRSEMNQMKQRLQEIRERISQAMLRYDPSEEFGIDEACYDGIVSRTDGFVGSAIAAASDSDFERAIGVGDGEETDFLHDPDYGVVYERHGWSYVREFLDEFAEIEDGGAYALCFEVTKEKDNHTAFANTVLGILLERNRGKEKKLDCTIRFSKDGKNHFWLLRYRPSQG